MSSSQLLGQLALVCASCDHFNAAGAPKCVSCGAAMDAPGKAAAPAAPPRPQTLSDAPPANTDAYARQAAPRAAAPPAAPAARPMNAPPIPAATRGPAPTAPPNLKPSSPKLPAVPPTATPVPLSNPKAPVPAAELLKKPSTPGMPAVGAPKAPAAAPAASGSNAARFALTVVGGPAQGQRFRLAGAGFVMGRTRGAILFPDDPFVSAHHATFTVRDGHLYVRDENSSSGIFVTIHGQESIPAKAVFSVGNRCFRFTGPLEAPAAVAGRPQVYGAPMPAAQSLFGVEELLVGGRPGKAVISSAPLLTIGSAKCDLSFSDQSLAPRHCELSPTLPTATLRDLSGGLGTYVRIPPALDRLLSPGDRLRVGEQILQVEAIG